MREGARRFDDEAVDGSGAFGGDAVLPEKRLFQGRIRHADGRLAAGAEVTIVSERKYFPLLLMLAQHQPLWLMTGTETDEEGAAWHEIMLRTREEAETKGGL